MTLMFLEQTLRDRLKGHTQRAMTPANCLKFTAIEGHSLKKWIIAIASRGAPPDRNLYE